VTTGLDPVSLRSYLDRSVPGLVTGPLAVSRIEGGRSNLTYEVSDGVNSWIVRRPPLGHVLSTAHDMGREFTVMSALAPSAVPVPATITLCEDESVIGAPFYVMENVRGAIYRTAKQAIAIGPDRVERLSDSLVDVLVDLHAVDPAAVGLADFGRPDGYLERQLRRWGKQLDSSRSREVEGIDELHQRLGLKMPRHTGHSGVVHGDYRLDNVIADPENDTVRAVLDWEMATLGDQLTDLGLMLMYWEQMVNPLEAGLFGRERVDGLPPTSTLRERYAARAGVDLDDLGWYEAFAHFKLAVIAEGIHYRYVAGQTLGEGFEQFGPMVPLLVARGLTYVEGHA
jgi:aminoglycoside phosphotransferase (APT) family kinase protein